MISIEKLKAYKKYSGDAEGFSRTAGEAEQMLFVGNRDWSVISELVQDVNLVKQEGCSPDAKARTLDSIRNSVEPGALPFLWEMNT
jgi:hypothetical protein